MSGEIVKKYGPGCDQPLSKIKTLKNPPEAGKKQGLGRKPTVYRPEVALAVLERLAAGETLTAICKDKGFPTPATFRTWAVNVEEVRAAFQMAKELRAHSLFEEALGMAREIRDMDVKTAQQVRAYDVALTHLRWSAGKLFPQDYGEKSNTTVVVPIQINTSLDLKGASAAQAGGYTLEAKLVPVENGDGETQKAVEKTE